MRRQGQMRDFADFFNDTATTEIYPLSLHDALPISGLSPRAAQPIARPTMPASASGELNTRAGPKAFWRPAVTLKTPPFPLHSARTSARLASATSSPQTAMRASRAISSRSAALMRSTIVVGSPVKAGVSSVSKAADAGSTSGGRSEGGGVGEE